MTTSANPGPHPDEDPSKPVDEQEAPFTIDFTAESLTEVRRLAVDAYRSLPYGGLEVAGILFGRIWPSGKNPLKVEVVASRPIECEHSAGPAFILSSSERMRLTAQFERAKRDEELADLLVVGFWVSHGRSELGLTSHDTDLYRAFFPHPWQFALIIKPGANRPVREQMFCRIEGRVFPYMPPKEPAEPEQALVEVGSVEAPAAPPLIPPSFPTDIYLPKPPGQPALLNTAAEPADDDELPRRPKLRSYWEVPPPASTQELVQAENQAEAAKPETFPAVALDHEAAPIVDELARLVAAIRQATNEPRPKRALFYPGDLPRNPVQVRVARHSFGMLSGVLLLVVGLLLGGGASYFLMGNRQPVVAKTVSPDLNVEMFKTGPEVLIHWDANSSVVDKARSAELRIYDGGKVQTFALRLSVLSQGYYRYQPASSNIQTTLAVTENDGRLERRVASRFSE